MKGQKGTSCPASLHSLCLASSGLDSEGELSMGTGTSHLTPHTSVCEHANVCLLSRRSHCVQKNRNHDGELVPGCRVRQDLLGRTSDRAFNVDTCIICSSLSGDIERRTVSGEGAISPPSHRAPSERSRRRSCRAEDGMRTPWPTGKHHNLRG